MGVERGTTGTDDRAVATAALIVFVGLFMLLAIIGGAFFVMATDDSGATDPTELSLSTVQCEVGTTSAGTGVSNATFSIRYRGSGDIDLTDATIDYIDENHDATYRIGENDSNRTIRVRNETGAHDPTISTGIEYTVTVPVLDARGSPLPADATATVELNAQGTAIIDLIRTPSAIGSDSDYVPC